MEAIERGNSACTLYASVQQHWEKQNKCPATKATLSTNVYKPEHTQGTARPIKYNRLINYIQVMPGTSNRRILDKSYSRSSKTNNFRNCREVDVITHSFPYLPSDVTDSNSSQTLAFSVDKLQATTYSSTQHDICETLCYPRKKLSHIKNHLAIFPSSQRDQTSPQSFW